MKNIENNVILFCIAGGKGSGTAFHVDPMRAGSLAYLYKGGKRWQAVMPGNAEEKLYDAFKTFVVRVERFFSFMY